MKKIICSLLLVSTSVFAHAQINAQDLEIGVHGGVSSNGDPSGNMPYKGDIATFNYSGHLSVIYHIHKNFQIGLEGRVTELSRMTDSVYLSPYKIPFGADGKKMVYAKYMVSGAFLANLQAPVGTKGGYVYAGAAVGYGTSRHKTRRLNDNESYRTPDGGSGMVFGGQVGFVMGLSKFIGLNIEGAYRSYTLNYDNNEVPLLVPKEQLNFSVTDVSGTIGLRFRLPYSQERHDRKMPAFAAPLGN